MDAGFPADAVAQAREAVKAHLRIGSGAEDAVIAGHARSALALGEAFTGRALIVREHAAVVSSGDDWQRLALGPVAAITAVERVSAGGGTLALASDDYAVDIDAAGEGWVRIRAAGAASRVRVAYVAGIAASWGELPAPLAQGVVLLAAHLTGGATHEPPAAVTALWRPWRRMQLNGGRHARV